MAFSKEQRNLFMNKIGELMAMKPDITLREIQKQMEANGWKLRLEDIMKYREKLLRRQAAQADRFYLNWRIGHNYKVHTTALTHAWNVVNGTNNEKTKLSALRLILDKEMEWTKLLVIMQVLKRDDPRLKKIMPVNEKAIIDAWASFRAQVSSQPFPIVKMPETTQVKNNNTNRDVSKSETKAKSAGPKSVIPIKRAVEVIDFGGGQGTTTVRSGPRSD